MVLQLGRKLARSVTVSLSLCLYTSLSLSQICQYLLVSDTDGGEGTDGAELAGREVPAGERLSLQPVDSGEM